MSILRKRYTRTWWLLVVLTLLATGLVAASVTQAAEAISVEDGDIAGLIAAINTANTTGQEIHLAPNGSYVLTAVYDPDEGPNGLPAITGIVTIQGAGATIKRIQESGIDEFRIFQVAPGAKLELSGVTIRGGSSPGPGGGIFNAGAFTLTNSEVIDNQSPEGGGGIRNTGTMMITESTISDNIGGQSLHPDSPVGGGGGISNLGVLSLTDSTVSRNSTFNGWGGGGGIANTGTLDIVNSTFIENESSGITNAGTLHVVNSIFTNNGSVGGGGIVNTPDGEVTMTSSALIGNGAGLGGGGISNGGTFALIDSEVSGNHAFHGGGGIFNNGTMTISDSVINDNFGGATDHPASVLGVGGGGIANFGTFTLTRSTVSGNETSSYEGGPISKGGGILNVGELEVVDSDFAENSAMSGGAIANLALHTGYDEFLVGTLNVTGTEFSGNTAINGAAILANGAETIAAVVNSTFAENTAETSGGAIHNTDGTMILTNVTVSDNAAGTSAGGISNAGTLEVVNTIVAGNTAQSDPDVHGDFTDHGHNLIGVDPLLDPAGLQDNGGTTKTIALMPGSPAIDTGNDEVAPDTDQRGVARPQGAASDIGAFEATIDEQLETLTAQLDEMDIHHGTKQSLVRNLSNVQDSLERDNLNAATGQLGAFINQVEAQRGKRLTDEQADQLVQAAETIKNGLGQ